MSGQKDTLDPYKPFPIKNERLQFTSTEPFTPKFVKSCLTQSADPSGIYSSRIQGQKILLDNPARDSKAKTALQEKRARRRKHQERKASGIIGRKEAKEKLSWHLDPTQAQFNLFLPLHHLWLDYMSELLGLHQPPSSSATPPKAQDIPSAAGMHAKLVKADFHGSIMTVRQSKNPCLVGISGIVILETENAFRVVTPKNQVKLLPKQGSVFSFSVPLYSTIVPSTPVQSLQPQDPPSVSPTNTEQKTTVLTQPHIEFQLYGNQFRFRAAERAGRKFKHKGTIEL